MIRTLLIVGVGAALLLAAIVVARPSEREGVPTARKKSGPREEGPTGPSLPTDSPEPARPALPFSTSTPPEEIREQPALPARDSFWEDLGSLLADRWSTDPAKHREAVLARTAAHLLLGETDRITFSATASTVAKEIDQAWAVRDQLCLTLPPDREKEEQAIQEAYEESKRRALERLERLLRDSAEHQEFRERLEEWIDAVR